MWRSGVKFQRSLIDMEKGSSIIYAVSLLMIWNFSAIDGFLNSCSEGNK